MSWILRTTATFLGCVFISNVASAQDLGAVHNLDVEGSVGLSASELQWSIGGGSHARSQLTYSGLRNYHAAIQIRYRLPIHPRWKVAISLNGRIGSTVDGDAQDSDFDWGNGREYSRSVSDVTGDGHLRLAAAIGMQHSTAHFPVFDNISLWTGFERHRQTLRMQNGRQIIPPYGDEFLKGLDSRYHSQWTGPWITTELARSLGPGRLRISGTWHLGTRYYAEGEWNLREELVQPRSFAQNGSGSGFNVGGRYTLSTDVGVAFIIEAGIGGRSIDRGTDTAFFASGDQSVLDLREVVFTSRKLSLGISKQF